MPADPTNTTSDASIVYRLAQARDIDLACDIYMDNFPHRLRWLFNRNDHGKCFLNDLIEWYLLANGQTFFTAQYKDQLAGYLILTMPHRTWPNLFRRGCVFRAAAHALTGRYGFRFWSQVFRRLARSIFSVSGTQPPCHTPHIPIIAVDNRYRGKGIGSHLMSQAMDTCRGSSGRMWLNVETDNHQVIRWYKDLGFQIIGTDADQHMMVWHDNAAHDQPKDDEYDSSAQKS